jgi:hypothetical protein
MDVGFLDQAVVDEESRRSQRYSFARELMRPWRYRLQHLAGQVMRATREVVDGKNSDRYVLAIHDGQSPQALVLHHAGRLLAVLILEEAAALVMISRSIGPVQFF